MKKLRLRVVSQSHTAIKFLKKPFPFETSMRIQWFSKIPNLNRIQKKVKSATVSTLYSIYLYLIFPDKIILPDVPSILANTH